MAANCIMSTAPKPKFGAISALALLDPNSFPTWSSRSSVKPVVPTTAWILFFAKNSKFVITASGVVKSTTTCAPELTSAAKSSPASSWLTSSKSSDAVMAAHTVEPIRPFAPKTPTLIVTSSPPCSLDQLLQSSALVTKGDAPMNAHLQA